MLHAIPAQREFVITLIHSQQAPIIFLRSLLHENYQITKSLCVSRNRFVLTNFLLDFLLFSLLDWTLD
jgi:hypothetical protein